MGTGAAGLVTEPVKWTERWITRAQRRSDLRAERFLKHKEGVRAGTEPPSLADRMESQARLFEEHFETSGILQQAYANERRISGHLPPAAGPYDISPGLADAWRTWVTDGQVRGPDGVRVTIWSGPPARICHSMTCPMSRHG